MLEIKGPQGLLGESVLVLEDSLVPILVPLDPSLTELIGILRTPESSLVIPPGAIFVALKYRVVHIANNQVQLLFQSPSGG